MSDYVTMFQNDTEQINQVRREYESEPAKGLVHGVQKDAIQNGFGARKNKSVVKACKGKWAFYFELKDVNGSPALIFWDEGTTGLGGEILSVTEIEEHSANGTLGPDQKLGRFLSRFQSGGNTGPGSFGRGKLIFQAASSTHSILIDSLREDNQYISLDRKVINNQLKQPPVPYKGDEAVDFIENKSGGALLPLQTPGTRITILDVDEEIVDSMNISFEGDDKKFNSSSFFYMIVETWWEILQMGAKIYLKKGTEELQVSLSGNLGAIISAVNEKHGYRTFIQKNIPVSVDDTTYQIKELKLILSPQNIEDELQEIWVQRKRMKIGGIDRHINKHHKVRKRLSGYVRIDSGLETFFEEAEGTTHYGFDMRKTALRKVREVVSSKVEEFQRILGYRAENTKARVQNELNEAMKELNEVANEIGLPTEFGEGKKKRTVFLSINSFCLPDENTTRVELNDKIGPIIYGVKNCGRETVSGNLIITCEQGREIHHEVFSQPVTVQPNEKISVEVPKLSIAQSDYNSGSMLLVRARLKRKNINSIYAQVSRSVWVGMDPPEQLNDYAVNLSLYRPKFPRKDTNRVELGEVLEGLGFSLANTSNIDLKLNIDVKVRRCKTQNLDVLDLTTLYSIKSMTLKAMADKDIDLEDLNISAEIFNRVFAEPSVQEQRKCEIFFSVRFAETYEYLEKLKGDHASRKKNILFYCGIDPEGQSIFKSIQTFHDPSSPLRAYTTGDKTEGYTFTINTGHAAYEYVEALGKEMRESYFHEQMIFHAASLAVRNKMFSGPLAEFAGEFDDETFLPEEAALRVDKLVGKILSGFRR